MVLSLTFILKGHGERLELDSKYREKPAAGGFKEGRVMSWLLFSNDSLRVGRRLPGEGLVPVS